VNPPLFDEYLGFPQGVEDFSIEQLSPVEFEKRFSERLVSAY
jgi:hypothetical protein